MARIVVTGGAGFLGSHLCTALLDRGDEVVCLDNLVTGSLGNIEHLFDRPGFTYVKHDVSQYVWVPGEVDAVLHFASPASPKDYLEMPIQTLKVGSLGTHNTLGLAKAKGARYFLASTSEVYGDPQVHPQTEGYWGHVNPVGPRGVYDEAKRFAEAMTMAYHRYHGLDVRIVRIFNSILADEQVIYDDGEELRRETVGTLAERLHGQVELAGFSVPAFDSAGRITSAETIALEGHPTSARCYEVRTAYGRAVRVTGDHSLFVRGPRGPSPKPVSDLAVGERVAVGRRIDVPERDRLDVDLIEVWCKLGGDRWSLAANFPGLGDEVWERRREVFELLRRERRPDCPNWRSAIWSFVRRLRESGWAPLAVVDLLGREVEPHHRVRHRVAGARGGLPRSVEITDELLWFLGLYVAEGCYYDKGKSHFISIACELELLDRAAKVAERELGLHVVRASGTASHPTPQIYLHSTLLLRLLNYLDFGAGAKRIPGWVLGLPLKRLKWFIEGYREGDGVHSGKKFEGGVRHEFSTISEDLKDDLIVAFARFGIVASVGQYETTFKQKTGDRRYPFWRLTIPWVNPWSPLHWDQGVEQHLQSPVTGDLVWASVKEIVEVPATPRVYDFCVPGRENFWAGTGIMAHNTYGERMRPLDGRVVSNFLVQALAGKPLTIYGDGTQTRSFCYVADEVRGILALLDSDQTGPINIGNPDEFTVAELADLVIEITGSRSEIVHEPLPTDDPAQRKPDITLARELLGWQPQVQLREGLERTTPWFRQALGD